MISAKQDAAIISYFFFEIIRNGAPQPRTVVTDFGKAILNAVARAFANCADLNNYLQAEYDVLHLNSSNILPCYVRLDINHFIAMIARWDCLRGKASKIRQFYIRSLARLYQMDSYNDVRKFLKSTLIVALSEAIGDSSDMPATLLPSQIHLVEINDMIKGITVNEPEENKMHRCPQDEISTECSWNTWAENIYTEAQEIAKDSIDGTVVNAFYNVEAAKKIKKLMCFLPLWTGIMKHHFKRGAEIATSSFVEAEFAEIKTRYFKNQLPMRVDKFILRHIEYVNGRLKLTCGTDTKEELNKKELSSPKEFEADDVINASSTNTEINKKKSSPVEIEMYSKNDKIEARWEDRHLNESDEQTTVQEKSYEVSPLTENKLPEISKTNDIEHSLNEIENWRGKIKRNTHDEIEETQVSKRRKNNYLTPCAEWDLCNTNKVVGLPILKNGSICNATDFNKQQIIVRETCAFDSIFQVVANGISTSNTYKTNMDALNTSNIFIKFVMDILQRGKIIASDYSTRAAVLIDTEIFKSNFSRSTRTSHSLNANCNAAHLIEKLFSNIPSYKREYHCKKCSHSLKKLSPTCNINVDEILKNGLNNMQKAIDDEIIRTNKTKCYKCKETVNYTVTYGPHLIIDTSIISYTDYLKNNRIKELKHTLDNVAKNVEIEENRYLLAGIVSYEKLGSLNYQGHYTAYTYANLHWSHYNDMPAKRCSADKNQVIFPHVILYIKQ
ncbi:hypothetical protein PUN28_015788 [Cardiocondyla obscurior]|uniref:NOF-FB transposable element protein n=1 Tax=Cardiocondyla obscurior TaxID=286306 RepID=A0AAW2EWX8_9HYME